MGKVSIELTNQGLGRKSIFTQFICFEFGYEIILSTESDLKYLNPKNETTWFIWKYCESKIKPLPIMYFRNNDVASKEPVCVVMLKILD